MNHRSIINKLQIDYKLIMNKLHPLWMENKMHPSMMMSVMMLMMLIFTTLWRAHIPYTNLNIFIIQYPFLSSRILEIANATIPYTKLLNLHNSIKDCCKCKSFDEWCNWRGKSQKGVERWLVKTTNHKENKRSWWLPLTNERYGK